MDFSDRKRELSEASELKCTEGREISKEACAKFDQLMGDDKIEDVFPPDNAGRQKLDPVEIDNKFNRLFDSGDFFEKNMAETEFDTEQSDVFDCEPDYLKKRETNSKYEFNGNTYETDDNGQTYKKNGELLANIEYTANGNRYRTNEHGNIVFCDSNPKYTAEGSRNIKEQKESGGEERREDDDGGHIIARILGGAEGEENLVPMRRTLNRGDYKRMENEIARALQEGKKVTMHVDIEYDGNSGRPSKISAEYTIDGKKTVCIFDNVERSIDLLDLLSDKISDEDYGRLKQTIKEMKEDGSDAAITSVKVEYDENDNPARITVGILDESNVDKTYRVYDPR